MSRNPFRNRGRPMQVRCVLVSLFLSVACAAAGRGQPDARIELSQGNFTAGDHFETKVTLSAPAPCGTRVDVYFQDQKTQRQFWVSGTVQAGQTAFTIPGDIPKDIPGGDYVSVEATIYPCPGYQLNKRLKLPSTTMSIKAYLDQIQYPQTADLELSLTQRQFLETKAAQLSNLSSQLTTRLEGHAADLPALREYLAGVVQSAEDDLNRTEEQYREQIMKPQDKLPAFFADFRAQYQALLISLRAPIPGVAEVRPQLGAKLLYVQLKKRAPSEQLSNTWPSAATAVWNLIRDNISAYKYIKDSGRITFNARITSFPTGARIQYKKLIDDVFQDYSSPTDVSNASFELATWIFKFHKDDCKDEPVLRINPYEDTDPEISVEFMHCEGK